MNGILELSDDDGRRYLLNTAQLSEAMQAQARKWMGEDMSQETMLRRAVVSGMLRTGQGMIADMARGLAPDAPADAFRRAKGQDILDWFSQVVARLVEYGLPRQSPIALQTAPTEGNDEVRTVLAVALAARAQPASSRATVERADAARTAI